MKISYSVILQIVSLAVLILSAMPLLSQQADTLRVISYNLDDFRNGNELTRVNSFSDVVDWIPTRPDILICQGVTDSIGAGLTWSILTVEGVKKQTPYLGSGHSILLYDSTRVELLVYNVIPTGHLPIDEWIMYNPISADTFIIASCQFVEGEDSISVAERAIQAQALRVHLHQRRTQKIIVAGTLNFYSSNEDGYRWLTEDAPFGDTLLRNPVRDPIGSVGIWHRNPEFARWHTYSTRIDMTLDTSGLVDRFDYVLVSSEVLMNILNLETYSVIGNTGTKFGKSATKNGQVVSPVTSGLENGSRHLPLYFDLIFQRSSTKVERTETLPGDMDLSRTY